MTHDPDETDTFFYLSFEVSLAEIQLNRCPGQRWQELLLVEFSAAFRDDGQFIDPVELVGEVVQRGKAPGVARLSFKYDKENRTLEIAEVDPRHREQLLKQFGWLFDR